MISLVLDTCTEKAVIAIFDNHKLLSECHLPFGYQNSSLLMPRMQEMFKTINLKPQQLNYIAVGKGPGSYTGMRVGAAVAKSLAYSLNIPLIGFCSLLGFVPEQDGSFVSMIDAKIGGVYLIKGTFCKGNATYDTEPSLCPLEELRSHLENIDFIVTANGKALRERLNNLVVEPSWQWIEREPSVVQLHLYAHQLFLDKAYNSDARLDLLYLRKTQAEIEKNRHAQN